MIHHFVHFNRSVLMTAHAKIWEACINIYIFAIDVRESTFRILLKAVLCNFWSVYESLDVRQS